MRLARALPLLVILPATLGAQQRDLAATADTVFARWSSTHGPGCAVGVARDGRTLLARGYGMANLETGTPITAETIFESGSVAKQFTATAVILLALDGKLSLDDEVRKYVPELPRYDRPITIRHLLTHTSGLREWSSLVAHAGWPRGQRAHTQADLLDVVYRQKSLNYPVGDFYSYTNSGYAIAMSLVERVSGRSFADFTRERIFEPLGMTKTGWRDDFTRIVPGRAQAYQRDGDRWQLAMPYENVVGPGGMLTTVGDWLIWNDALASRKLGAVTDSIVKRMRLTSGREIPYALGVIVDQYRGVPEIAHSGSTGGYSTFLARYPQHDNLSIAVLCNSAQGAAGTYVHALADRLITNFPPAPVAQAGGSAPGAQHFGIYRSLRTGAPLDVNAESVLRLRANPDGSFGLPNGTRWVFADGRLSIAQPDGDTTTYVVASKARWVPSAQELRAFAGRYRSDDVGATHEVSVAGDSLRVTVRPGLSSTLRPVYPDAFQRGGTVVRFVRDRRGNVVAMHYGEGRVWDLPFSRIP